MVSVGTALALGLAAGLALAMPFGPVALLVVSEGISRGLRVASGAAAGVAATDAGYAVLAATAGEAVAGAVDGHEALAHASSALVLLAVAVHGFRRELRPSSAPVPAAAMPPTPAPTAAPTPAPTAAPTAAPSAAPPVDSSPARAFVRFAALTAINPLTALTVAAIAVALGARLDGPARPAFVLGVAFASAAWQLGLAVAGSILSSRLGPRARRTCTLLGHAGVAVLAGVIAVT